MKPYRSFSRFAGTSALFAAIALLGGLMLLGLGGCAQTPQQRMSLALDTYTAAANTTTAMIDAGKIKDRNTLLALEAVSAEMSVALKQAKAQIDAGNEIDANFWVTMVINAKDRLLAYLVQVQRTQ